MTVNIKYLSDLHTELQTLPVSIQNIEKDDVCILAGDIASADYFREERTDADARKAQKRFNYLMNSLHDTHEHILYVLGNHEHYGSVFDTTKFRLSEYLKRNNYDKVTILDNDVFKLDGVLFVGATLWTDYNNANPMDMMTCMGGMNDYRWIYKDMRNSIDAPFILNKHYESKEYIKTILFENLRVQKTTDKIVVITHHAPSKQAERRDYSSLSPAFVSNLDHVYGDYEVSYWIHGHTHYNTEYKMGEIKVLTNQHGYIIRQENKHFDFNKRFTI